MHDSLNDNIDNIAAALQRDGYYIARGVLDAPALAELRAALPADANAPAGAGAGLRQLATRVPKVAQLAASERLRQLIVPLLGERAGLVRAL